MNTTYVFHTDAGHGWLEVSSSDLTKVGLTTLDISQYSYKQRSRLFLEEDCDAPKFIKAFVSKNGNPPAFIQNHTDDDFVEKMRLTPIHY